MLPPHMIAWIDLQVGGSQHAVGMLRRALPAMMLCNKQLVPDCVERCFSQTASVHQLFVCALAAACSTQLVGSSAQVIVVGLHHLASSSAIVRQAAVSLLVAAAAVCDCAPWLLASSSAAMVGEIASVKTLAVAIASDIGQAHSLAVLKQLLIHLLSSSDPAASRIMLVCAAPFCEQLVDLMQSNERTEVLTTLMQVSKQLVSSVPQLVLQVWHSLALACEQQIGSLVGVVLPLATDGHRYVATEATVQVATVAVFGMRNVDPDATVAALMGPWSLKQANAALQ